MNIRTAAVAACIALGSTPAAADILTVVYTGTATGFYELGGSPPQIPFTNVSATETYVFDTSKGTLTFAPNGFTLVGGELSARIDLDISAFGQLSGFALQNSLIVNGQTVDVPIDGSLFFDGFHQISVNSSGQGLFQFGTCPGGICGIFTALTTTITGDLPVPSPVPLPAVGGGLPGALMLGWLFWQRRRQVKVQVKLRPSP